MTTARARKHAETQLAIAQRSVRFWEGEIARLEAGPHPLRTYRHGAGVTLSELAGRVGASHASISRIETGAQLPSPRLAKAIEAETGVPRWRLLPDVFDAPGAAA